MRVKKQDIIPVGTIMPWHKSLSGVPQSLSPKWVECNGQTLNITGSPLNGLVIPDLNGGNLFLRGSISDGTTGGALTHYHSYRFYSGWRVSTSGTGTFITYTNSTTDVVSNEPAYMNVVYIMKVI